MEGPMMKKIALVAATLLLCSFQSAVAQTAQERAACQGDFKKLCPGVMPGGGRPIACLSQHADKLSPDCKKVIDAHAKK
jgi:hypothetical protein